MFASAQVPILYNAQMEACDGVGQGGPNQLWTPNYILPQGENAVVPYRSVGLDSASPSPVPVPCACVKTPRWTLRTCRLIRISGMLAACVP